MRESGMREHKLGSITLEGFTHTSLHSFLHWIYMGFLDANVVSADGCATFPPKQVKQYKLSLSS